MGRLSDPCCRMPIYYPNIPPCPSIYVPLLYPVPSCCPPCDPCSCGPCPPCSPCPPCGFCPSCC
ncbi:male-specific sperm protein Mst84Dd-like [Diabrotica virgifera virgifera]|uniref:Male-specific sperm protein Mst84Dd-like n=1 Tax=Diabrotica virgifera virgifera TaxID=50390 RepID=A0A6P7GNQ5_DIAVI|nr:male-specific sperm protein Mst84Dd-like [Diabrotica virgifera virgifera]